MRTLHTEIDIEASADTVWEILADFDGYSHWNPFVREISGTLEEGAQLEVRLEPPGSKSSVLKPRVTMSKPGLGFGWKGKLISGLLFSGEHRFILDASPDGAVRFIHEEKFGGMLVPLLWRSLDQKVRAGFEAMNRALKNLAEASEHGVRRPPIADPATE